MTTALLVCDMQETILGFWNDCAEKAAFVAKAALVLQQARQLSLPVIHVSVLVRGPAVVFGFLRT